MIAKLNTQVKSDIENAIPAAAERLSTQNIIKPV